MNNKREKKRKDIIKKKKKKRKENPVCTQMTRENWEKSSGANLKGPPGQIWDNLNFNICNEL
jgi:hypothetical protein